MIFYLGLSDPPHIEQLKVPYIISCRRLINRSSTIWGEDWLMDSGGFTELQLYGKYKMSEDEYIETIQRFRPTIAFCQDWACLPSMIKKTGLTIKTHQQLTTDSYLSMINKTPRVAPVLQGYSVEDFIAHARQYESNNVDMNQIFGIGSIALRKNNIEKENIIVGIKKLWPSMKLHAFGLKLRAFNRINIVGNLYSADSIAWSYYGRREQPLPFCNNVCTRRSMNCSHCSITASVWYKKALYIIKLTSSINNYFFPPTLRGKHDLKNV